MEEIKFTRKELYDLVWSEPLSRLARKYNISDNGIRKRCKKMNIPLPKAGYWSKSQHGYKVPKLKLPGNYKGETETVLCFRDKDGKYVENVQVDSPFKNRKKEILNDTSLPIKVPDVISRSDSLIVQARKTLSKKQSRSYDFVDMYKTNSGEVNIVVSKPNMERALQFMDTLIKLLRARNHNIVIESFTTYAVVYGEKIPVRLREKCKIVNTVDNFGPKRELHPNGTLAFIHDRGAYSQKEWKDSKVDKVEDKLPDILAYLEIYAKQEIEDRIEYERQRKIEEEERQRLKELQKRKDSELGKIKELIQHALVWKQAQVVREYLKSLSQNTDLSEERKEWLDWACKKIEWFDPFTQGTDEILDDEDRNELITELNETKPQKNSYWNY